MTTTTTSPSTETVAWVWWSWVYSEDHEVAEMHVCCRPGWEGRWLSRRVLAEGFVFMSALCDVCLALHSDRQLRRVLRRLGFVQSGDHVNIWRKDHELHREYLRGWQGEDRAGHDSRGRAGAPGQHGGPPA